MSENRPTKLLMLKEESPAAARVRENLHLAHDLRTISAGLRAAEVCHAWAETTQFCACLNSHADILELEAAALTGIGSGKVGTHGH